MSGTDLVDSKAIFKARPYSKQGHTQKDEGESATAVKAQKLQG